MWELNELGQSMGIIILLIDWGVWHTPFYINFSIFVGHEMYYSISVNKDFMHGLLIRPFFPDTVLSISAHQLSKFWIWSKHVSRCMVGALIVKLTQHWPHKWFYMPSHTIWILLCYACLVIDQNVSTCNISLHSEPCWYVITWLKGNIKIHSIMFRPALHKKSINSAHWPLSVTAWVCCWNPDSWFQLNMAQKSNKTS